MEHTLFRGMLLAILAVVMFACNLWAEGEPAQKKPVGRYEPEKVDMMFEEHVGKKLEPMVGDNRLGIKRIDGFDDALDSFTAVSPFDFELGFTLANMYLWRGLNLGSDTSWMPYVTVSPDFEPFGDLSFTYWADITQNERGNDEREFDFVVDYTFSFLELMKQMFCYNPDDNPELITKLLDFEFSAGYIYYYFPPDSTDSHEYYFKMVHNLPLHPYMAIYHDFDQGSGTWIERGISQDFDLKLFTLSTFASIGYNHRQWVKDEGFANLHFGGSIPVELGTHMIIEPFLSYSKRLNKLRDDDDNVVIHDELYGGFNYSIRF